jgi:hypothetical protein
MSDHTAQPAVPRADKETTLVPMESGPETALSSLSHGAQTLPASPAAATGATTPGSAPPTRDSAALLPAPSRAQAQVPVATGLAMKRRNPFAVWLGLPLLTLGIYHLVWYYKIHKEMAEFDRRRSVPVAGPMLVLLFLSWTLIAPIVSYHNAGARIRNAQRTAGLGATCSPTLAWLLLFTFGLNSLYLQMELNKITDRYAGTPAGTTVGLYV